MLPRRRRLLLVVPAVLSLATTLGAQRPEPIKFARFPHVANDGTIAFTYQDDIWIAGPDGSNPRRLTAHVARDVSPRFSPDGQWIAFTSNRMGNNDVFVVASSGGEPRQLTYFSGDDQALYWAPDGRSIVLASARGPHPFGSPLYRVALDGTVPVPMGMDFGRAGMIKQDATLVAFNRSLPTYWRKGYRGNNSADIAVQDVRSGEITEITDTNLQEFKGHVNDVHPMWGADGMLYFASERDGIFNIWRIGAKGGAAQQVTRHRDDGVQFPAISPDGRRIIYENEFDLWTLDVPNGTPRKIAIAMTADAKENDVAVIGADSRADGFSPSANGEYLAVDVHGEIVIVPSEQGFGEKTQVTSSPWRERFQTYSPDGRKIAYVSDESGEEEIWVWDMATSVRRKLTSHESVKADLTWAPSSQKLAFTAANRLWEVDAAGGDARELAHNPAGGFSIQQYSADGNWIVYSHRDDDQNADVYLFDVRARKEYNVSKSPFNELTAALTPDGKTIVFTSTRDGGTNQLFAASLARLAEDPNDPLVRERRRRERERADSAGGPPPIRVDVPGLERRAVQLTRGAQAVSGFFLSRDGRTVYFATGAGGFGGGGQQPPDSAQASENGLFAVSIEGRDRRRIAAGTFAGMVPTQDRRTVFFRRNAPNQGEDDAAGPPTTPGFEIHRLSLGGGGGGAGGGGAAQNAGAGAAGATAGQGAAGRSERVRFSFPVRVDRRAEWNQTFEEAWRVMKYRFYDEKMHGRDWAAIKARYKPLLKYVGTNEDLYDLANEMIGELNASHTGVSGPPTRAMPRAYTTRFLGFELEPANGRYRVSHVYRDGPADKEWIDLAVGDYVLAIDGKELKAGDNYWKSLSETLNEYVPVRVAKSPNGDGAKVVRINSVTSLTDIKYEEWVANNRDFVDKESNGDIAYVHIRSMNQPSLVRFRNEIDQFANKKGIVVDIRFNGGGNIDQELIDILERRPYQFWNARNGSRTWGRRPRQAIAGPKVMLVNARSGSDSEVTPMGFRQLGLGRIVGNPTAAAVIATGSYQLINGGAIRTPGSLVITYDPTKPNNYGVNLENYGVPPDVWVENSPMDQLKRFDRELKVAVDEAKRMMKAPEQPKVVQ
jgi:tricorn protease